MEATEINRRKASIIYYKIAKEGKRRMSELKTRKFKNKLTQIKIIFQQPDIFYWQAAKYKLVS